MAKTIIKWAVINGAFAAALWFGFVEGVDGARQVALFLVWALAVLTLVMLSDRFIEEALKSDKPLLPHQLTVPFDVAVVVFLAWHGAMASAAAYSFHSLIEAAVKKRIRDERTNRAS